MSFDSESLAGKATLPYCCIECSQAYTLAHFEQSLEAYLAQNDSLQPERNNNVVCTKCTGSSKSVSRGPRYVQPETDHLNVSRNNRDDNTLVLTQPRYSRKRQFSYTPENGIEPNPKSISSVPTQGPSPSNRTYNRPPSQNARGTGHSYGATKPRKSNEDRDLPPIPTQDTSSSNPVPQLQYPPQTQGTAKPQDRLEPPSIPSVRTEERNQSNYAQTRPLNIRPRVTRVSFSGNTTPAVAPSTPLAQIAEQANAPQTRSQPQETTQASSNVNKFRDWDRAERFPPKPTQDPSKDRTDNTDGRQTDSRPHLLHGTPSQMDTQYVNMLLALDDIPKLHNMYAAFFNWILLAGFILFPGTFTSLRNLGAAGQVDERLVRAITSIPLFVLAWLCTGVGASGMLWLWWRWRKNYIWVLNRIFLPGAMNSLAGFISTMANVFGVQHGELSTTSKITIIVTAASTGVLGILTAIYSLWLVRRVKSQHDKEVGKERTGEHGEGAAG